jgi:hypothetical protein
MCLKLKSNPILIVSVLILAITAIGTVGYMLIEHFSFLDAVYFAVSVLTTLGIDANHQFSSGGKVFTTVLALVGALIFIFAAGFLADWFFSRATGKKPNEAPAIGDFAADLDFFKGSEKEMRLAVVKVPADMKKIDALKRYGVVIIGVEKGKYFDVNISFSTKLKKGSSVVVMGDETQIKEFS